jgi:Ni,Fe-hydrogenase III large subunit
VANREQEVKAYERQKEALSLRLVGLSYDAIAERLGFANRSGSFRAVQAALKKTLQEPADELRTLELERLDSMLLPLMAQAKKGNQGAVDRVLRIMERRAKLLGLDAPTKQEVTGKDGGPLVIAIGGLDPDEDI